MILSLARTNLGTRWPPPTLLSTVFVEVVALVALARLPWRSTTLWSPTGQVGNVRVVGLRRSGQGHDGQSRSEDEGDDLHCGDGDVGIVRLI